MELSGDGGEVVFKDDSEGSSGTGELKLYPEALPGGEAVQAARYAAKLLPAAEDYYNHAAAGRGSAGPGGSGTHRRGHWRAASGGD